jgi:hypothetical protein
MEPEQIKTLIDGWASEYLWWFMGIAAALFFKNGIEKFVSGLTFLFGSDYNLDDEVYINGIKRATIVRQTIGKTVFYLHDTNRRLVIPNNQLHSLRCEKVLPGGQRNREEESGSA